MLYRALSLCGIVWHTAMHIYMYRYIWIWRAIYCNGQGLLECICADCVITGCLAWVYHVILDEMKDIAVWIFLFCFDVVAAPL